MKVLAQTVWPYTFRRTGWLFQLILHFSTSTGNSFSMKLNCKFWWTIIPRVSTATDSVILMDNRDANSLMNIVEKYRVLPMGAIFFKIARSLPWENIVERGKPIIFIIFSFAFSISFSLIFVLETLGLPISQDGRGWID